MAYAGTYRPRFSFSLFLIMRLPRIAFCFFLYTVQFAAAQSASLSVTVVDENSVAVPAARISLESRNGLIRYCQTGCAGHCDFSNMVPGLASLRAEKEG